MHSSLNAKANDRALSLVVLFGSHLTQPHQTRLLLCFARLAAGKQGEPSFYEYAADHHQTANTDAMMSSNEQPLPEQESLWKRLQRKSQNAWVATKIKSVNGKEQAIVTKLNFDIQQRKKQFGVDYLTLKQQATTSEDDLQSCIDMALGDIKVLQDQIDEHEKVIADNQIALQQKIAGGTVTTPAAASEESSPATVNEEGDDAVKPELVSASEL